MGNTFKYICGGFLVIGVDFCICGVKIVSRCFIKYLHFFLAHDILCLDYSCEGEMH